MAHFIEEDMGSDYATTAENDFKAQAKKHTAPRRPSDATKVIPLIVQQRAKERELKKKKKRETSAKNKDSDIKRAQSRIASGRRQLLYNAEHKAIELDNVLADELSLYMN